MQAILPREHWFIENVVNSNLKLKADFNFFFRNTFQKTTLENACKFKVYFQNKAYV